MKGFLFLVFSIVLLSKITSNDSLNWISITQYNLDEVLRENEKIFVLFFKIEKQEDIAKNDPYIQELKKLTKRVKQEKIFDLKIGVVDVANNPNVAERLGITEFPLFRLYIEESPVYYNGAGVTEEIIYFLKLKLLSPSQELYIPDDVEKFVENKEAVIYLGLGMQYDPNYKSYLNVARMFDDVLFGHCGMLECIEHYKLPLGTILFIKNKHQYELQVPYTDSMIRQLVEKYSTPIRTQFDETVADLIFNRNSIGIFLFRDANNSNHKIYELIFKRVARFFKGDLWFMIIDIKTPLEEELARITRVGNNDMPCIFIHDAREENILSYKLQAEINEESLYKFIVDFKENKLSPYYTSEETVPLDQQTFPIQKLVGKSFQELILNDQENNSLIYIYAEGCKHCKKAGKLFEKLVEVLLKKNKNIKFFKLNSDLNELPGIDVVGLPNFKLFVKGNKNEPKDYPLDQDRSIKRLANFIKNHVNNFDISDINHELDADFEYEFENPKKVEEKSNLSEDL